MGQAGRRRPAPARCCPDRCRTSCSARPARAAASTTASFNRPREERGAVGRLRHWPRDPARHARLDSRRLVAIALTTAPAADQQVEDREASCLKRLLSPDLCSISRAGMRRISTKSTICFSPSSRRRPPIAAPTKPQWPPCALRRRSMCGLPVSFGSWNGCDGTNGSSSAVMISAGTRMRSIDAHRAGAMIVVLGVAEAEVRRGVGLVELADGPDRVERRQIERARAELVLAPHAALQVLHEIPLIQHVPGRSSARVHSLISMIGDTAATPTSVGGAHRRTRRRASAPGCRRANSRDRRSPAARRRASARARRARRRRSGRSGRALPTDAPCRRSCAGSAGRRSCRARTLSRRGRACSARRSIRSGRAARERRVLPRPRAASDNRRQRASSARHRSSGASAPAAPGK